MNQLYSVLQFTHVSFGMHLDFQLACDDNYLVLSTCENHEPAC